MMKNIVITDFEKKTNWKFLEILNVYTKESWSCKYKNTNKFRNNKLLLIIWYFLFPLQIVISRKKYNKIIAWQQFFGLNIAFFCRLFHLKKTNSLYIMTFIYKQKDGIIGDLFYRYMNYIVSSKYVDKLIVFSKKEVDYYNSIFYCISDKLIYIPLGKTDFFTGEICDKGYVFATGRSNRDYDFLVRVLNETSYNSMIVCDSYYSDIAPKDNVQIFRNCYGNEMLKLMARCHIVVIPLENINVSSGQLVILQAMSLGKPVICTKTNGVIDYIDEGNTGLLVNNTIEEWTYALKKIYEDDRLYKEMSLNSTILYKQKYTEETMYKNIASMIK